MGVSAASLGKLRPNDKQRPLRDETFEYLKDLMGGESCLRSNTNCVFRSRGELTHALEDGLGKALLPSELAALKGAVEIFAPPPLLPKLGPFFSVLLALAGLLLTKGFSAYGFEIFGPLRSLMSGDARGSAGNEPTGTVERYRTEFSYLSKALGGRLVIFIDDLDRCDEATVNSVLELTNYLIDHSECFIVIGAAMDHVRRCIRPRSTAEAPLTGGPLETYQYDYLEKLIHLQFPVPRAKREQVDRLAGPPSTEDPAWSAQVAQAFKSYGVVAAVCGMLLVGGVGFWDAIHPVERTVLLPTAASFADARARAAEARARQLAAQAQQPQQQAIQTAVSSGAAQSLQPSPPSKAVLPQAARANAAATARGDLFDRMAWTVGLLVAAFLAFTYLVDPKLRQQVKLSLGGAVITKDSLRFQQAISLWAPLATDTNPRRFKRFVNHARLLVHYDRRMRGEETGANRPAARDAHIVALTALYKRDPLSRHNLERFANDPAIAPVLREHCQTTTEYAELGAILSDRYLVQLLRQLATRRASHGPTAIPRPEGSVRPQRLRRVRSRAPMQAAP